MYCYDQRKPSRVCFDVFFSLFLTKGNKNSQSFQWAGVVVKDGTFIGENESITIA